MRYAKEWEEFQAKNPAYNWDDHFIITHLQELGFEARMQTYYEIAVSKGPLSIFNGVRWRTGEVQYGYHTSDLRDGSWAYIPASELHFKLMVLPCANTTDDEPGTTTTATQKES